MPSGFAWTARITRSLRNARGLGIGAADQLVDRLDQLMRAEHFGRVQAAVDPDHGLAFRAPARAPASSVSPSARCQPARDLLVAIELLVVLRRRDDRHQLRAALGGLADLHHLHAIRFLVELLPVLDELRVGGELIVVADVEAEELLGRGDGLRPGGGRTGEHQRACQQTDARDYAYSCKTLRE